MPHTSRLQHELRFLAAHNKHGSFETRGNRLDILLLCADQLQQLGFQQLRVHQLKLRHVHRLVQHWKTAGLQANTIRNRLSALRWWAGLIGHGHMLPASNHYFGIATRAQSATTQKAQIVTEAQIQQIPDPWIQWSVRLAVAFGMRRKEVLLIHIWHADKGDHLLLTKTKGNRPRQVPIRTEAQRAVVNGVKAFVRQQARAYTQQSLIPADQTFIAWRQRYDALTHAAGLTNLHGVRHHYSQQRMEEETGRKAPIAGGPSRRSMTKEERARDNIARQHVSEELGHRRRSIVGFYVGT